MSSHFQALDQQVLAAFSEPLDLIREDGSTAQIGGIVRDELSPAGSMEAVMLTITTLTVSNTVALYRGDRIQSPAGTWTVDRKIRTSGTLSFWNLYAD